MVANGLPWREGLSPLILTSFFYVLTFRDIGLSLRLVTDVSLSLSCSLMLMRWFYLESCGVAILAINLLRFGSCLVVLSEFAVLTKASLWIYEAVIDAYVSPKTALLPKLLVFKFSGPNLESDLSLSPPSCKGVLWKGVMLLCIMTFEKALYFVALCDYFSPVLLLILLSASRVLLWTDCYEITSVKSLLFDC